MLPELALPDTSGRLRSLWEFKQRHPLLLLVAPGLERDAATGDWLERLGTAWTELVAHDARLVVVTRAMGPQARRISDAFGAASVILLDRDGEGTRAFLPGSGPGVALYLTDRYLLCIGRWLGVAGFPAPDALLVSLAFAEQDDCACGLPAWPEE
jgi:hypothetical protein